MNEHPDVIDVQHFVRSRIRERRLELKLSQYDLAALLGVTAQQVAKYENGPGKINVERVFQLAQALEAPVHHFFPPLDGEVPAVAADRATIEACRSLQRLPEDLRKSFLDLLRRTSYSVPMRR